MSGEPARGRPLLRQSNHPDASPTRYSMPISVPPRSMVKQQKNYVFVDEHNRHKRLKVSRACDGCRRRKIKCDSATTNSWPCASCSRLKLNCVPPTVLYDMETSSGVHTYAVKMGESAVTSTGNSTYLDPRGSVSQAPQAPTQPEGNSYQPNLPRALFPAYPQGGHMAHVTTQYGRQYVHATTASSQELSHQMDYINSNGQSIQAHHSQFQPQLHYQGAQSQYHGTSHRIQAEFRHPHTSNTSNTSWVGSPSLKPGTTLPQSPESAQATTRYSNSPSSVPTSLPLQPPPPGSGLSDWGVYLPVSMPLESSISEPSPPHLGASASLPAGGALVASSSSTYGFPLPPNHAFHNFGLPTYSPFEPAVSVSSLPRMRTPQSPFPAQGLNQPSAIAPTHDGNLNPQSAYVQHSMHSWRPPTNIAAMRAMSLDSSSRNQPHVEDDDAVARRNSFNGGWDPAASADELAEAMGCLKIDHLAVAPYIADRERLANAEVVTEWEVILPDQRQEEGRRLRIPMEMMPDDDLAQSYFDYFFIHLHEYVPVLHRQTFLHQWHNDRDSISPLLLEAIFASVTLTQEDEVKGPKWLALATKHTESFKDVPRLSTLQALLILLKAGEGAPRRGYFYRSWMAVVNLTAMAKDLDLHRHKRNHKVGRPCNLELADCVASTRIWQLIYILEVMIGGPQGRQDFAVDEGTVDFDKLSRREGWYEDDFAISVQFVYLARVVRNIRSTIRIYAHEKETTNGWYLTPEFVGHNDVFTTWPTELPAHLHVGWLPSGLLHRLPSSFVGNLHCYHYLSLIMHHRPQIHYMKECDGNWKQHMLLCIDAAKRICKIQESIIKKFGVEGLICMQRGISFTIYCVLTCTMLHLASLTSPDADLSHEARDYFVRHMKVLETCAPHWHMDDVQKQITELRKAFSADIRQPFELKPSFHFGSPTSESASLSVSGQQGTPTTNSTEMSPEQDDYSYAAIDHTYAPTSIPIDWKHAQQAKLNHMTAKAMQPHTTLPEQSPEGTLMQLPREYYGIVQQETVPGTTPEGLSILQPRSSPQGHMTPASQASMAQLSYSPHAGNMQFDAHAMTHETVDIPQQTFSNSAPERWLPQDGHLQEAMWEERKKRAWDASNGGQAMPVPSTAKRQR